MKLRFPRENQTTEIRVFPKRAAVWAGLKRKKPVLVWDDGIGEAPAGFEVFRVPGGEAVKSWSTVEALLSWLHGRGHERREMLCAVGGGAVCDMAALAASLYRRGVPLILVPTTMVAQVDAAIGGKTAVDTADGRKNFAGNFYPASEVWLCPEFLNSLSERERRSGAGELLKILWIAGAKVPVAEIRDWIATGRVSQGLWRAVLKGVETKIRIVEKDPLDLKRVREVLNFGHTVGHALESLADGSISHGEAIAWGMAVEAGLVPGKSAGKVRELLLSLGFPKFPAQYALTDWASVLASDKKIRAAQLEMSVVLGKKIVKLRKSPRAVGEAALRFFSQRTT